MALDDRERNFEDALARNLQAHRSANTSVGTPAPASAQHDDCPDAEILAAYHERLLDADEMIFRKQHISSCLRCQEVLAQLEATEEISLENNREEFVPGSAVAVPQMQPVHTDPASAPPLAAAAAAKSSAAPSTEPFAAPSITLELPRRSTSWRWLVPAGALAAGLLLWVAIRDRIAPETQFKLAKNQSQPVPEPSPRSPSPPMDSAREKSAQPGRQAPQAAKIAPSPKSDAAIRDELAVREETRKQKPVLPSSVPALSGSRGDLQSNDSVASAKQVPNPHRVLPPSSSDSGALTQNTTLEPSRSAAPQASDSAVPVLPVPQEAKKEEGASNGVAGAPSFEQSQTVRGATLALRQTGQPANLRAARNPVLVSSPNGNVVWRLLSSGIIQRSDDSGANWTIQKTPVVADFFAGSAPSNKICWVVGRNGAILLTTDGGHQWLQIPSPTTDNITSVFAVDAQQATISAAKNISYKTTNGGMTWTPLPNP